MTTKELAAEIQRLTPPPVEDMLRERWEFTKPLDQAAQARRQAEQARQAAEHARQDAAQWRKAHPSVPACMTLALRRST